MELPSPAEPVAPAKPAPALTVLRFSLTAADAAAIAASLEAPASAPASTPLPRARHFTETWYDTTGHNLLRHGLALSTAKARRFYTQTLSQNGISVTAPIQEALPEPAAFGPGWQEPLETLLQGEPLTPAFSTQIKRLIRQAGGVELRFKSGHIQTGAEKIPFNELELHGPGGELFLLALTLSENHQLILQPAGLAQRGIWAIGAARPSAVKAGAGLSGAICLDDAVAALTQSCLSQFTANWAVFTAGTEVKSVHQMRVAMRRLRSVLGLFNRNFAAPEFFAFRNEAKRLATLMGEARNWDVFTALLRAGPVDAFPHEPGFAAMLTQCAGHRDAGYTAVRSLLADPVTTRFLLSAELFLARHGWRNGLGVEALVGLTAPAQDFAAANLERLHRKVRKTGKHLLRDGMHEKHLTRIELKKLRYTADLFGGLFEAKGKIKTYNRIAAALQEELGQLNDLATAEILLGRLDCTTPDNAKAIGIVLGWCAQAAASDDKQLGKLWKDFAATKPFTS